MIGWIAVGLGVLMGFDAVRRLPGTAYRDRAIVILELMGGVVAFGAGIGLLIFR